MKSRRAIDEVDCYVIKKKKKERKKEKKREKTNKSSVIGGYRGAVSAKKVNKNLVG